MIINPNSTVFQIKHSRQIDYCDDLAHKNSEALSFIPRPRIEEYASNGQILGVSENDDICGFLIFGNGRGILRVFQACIQYDARTRCHGESLVMELIRLAEKRHCEAISLKCADDLEANGFWSHLGFVNVGKTFGGQRRGRMINHWFLNLQPFLFPFQTTETFLAAAGQQARNVRIYLSKA